MADRAEIAAILKTLAEAYPGQRLERPTLQAYLERLGDIPAHLLAAAAEAHIAQTAWFPKISELRQAAARLAGTSRFQALDPAPVDHLAAEAQALEDAFYRQGRLEADEWERLAAQYERLDRPHRAAHAREKLRRLQALQAARVGEGGGGAAVHELRHE
jgi:hypothetical protein